MFDFLKNVVLSNASREIREKALEMLMSEIQGFIPVGNNIKINPEMYKKIKRLMAARKTIEAIKLLRRETGLGLKDAKDIVDSIPLDINDIIEETKGNT